LLFRSAVVAVSAILVAYTVATLAFGLMSLVALKGFLVLAVTGAMGTLVYYNIERAYRKSFLEGALIAELVARDALTGLMNRRSLDEHLLRVWQQAQRDRRTITVLMVDIDHFKSYNDTHGHQAGDAALRAVARQLNSFARRPLDIAARYGGDEFVAILYDMQLDHVKGMTEGLRRAVQSAALATPQAKDVPGVTVSIGAGIVEPTLGRTPLGALQFADEALYEAKQNGRNCVFVKDSIDYRQVDTGAFKSRIGSPN
jgi:diguanylate cyclase (GGDEF)-like protein